MRYSFRLTVVCLAMVALSTGCATSGIYASNSQKQSYDRTQRVVAKASNFASLERAGSAGTLLKVSASSDTAKVVGHGSSAVSIMAQVKGGPDSSCASGDVYYFVYQEATPLPAKSYACNELSDMAKVLNDISDAQQAIIGETRILLYQQRMLDEQTKSIQALEKGHQATATKAEEVKRSVVASNNAVHAFLLQLDKKLSELQARVAKLK